MKLLHLHSNILGETSAGHLLSADVVRRILTLGPDDKPTCHDLVVENLPHLPNGHITALYGQPPENEGLASDLAIGEADLAELEHHLSYLRSTSAFIVFQTITEIVAEELATGDEAQAAGMAAAKEAFQAIVL